MPKRLNSLLDMNFLALVCDQIFLESNIFVKEVHFGWGYATQSSELWLKATIHLSRHSADWMVEPIYGEPHNILKPTGLW